MDIVGDKSRPYSDVLDPAIGARDSHDRFYKLSVHPVEGGDSREEGEPFGTSFRQLSVDTTR